MLIYRRKVKGENPTPNIAKWKNHQGEENLCSKKSTKSMVAMVYVTSGSKGFPPTSVIVTLEPGAAGAKYEEPG